MNDQPILCVFLRSPNLGQVKTRLAADIGTTEALAAYLTLVEHTFARLAKLPTSIEIQYWLADSPISTVAVSTVTAWQRAQGGSWHNQQGDNLGARMWHCLASCLAQGRPGIIIGTDCPPIDAGYISAAIAALSNGANLVLGPAEDGGYGLIGLRGNHAELFDKVSWSTSAVMSQTLQRAAQLKLDCVQLDTIWDVDTVTDWRRFHALGNL